MDLSHWRVWLGTLAGAREVRVVKPLVGFEVGPLGEGLPAPFVVALKRLFTGVDAHVRAEVVLEGELLAAVGVVAGEGAFLGVDQHVSLQFRALDEGAPAGLHRTHEALRAVDAYVLLEARAVAKLLAALLADVFGVRVGGRLALSWKLGLCRRWLVWMWERDTHNELLGSRS